MDVSEQTISAMLDAEGCLKLSELPAVAPGPVTVTIRAITGLPQRRGLVDVVREIAAEQRARQFLGRTADDVKSAERADLDDDQLRDEELADARRKPHPRES